jgi:hypothetical protein
MSASWPIRQLYVDGHNAKRGYAVSLLLEDAPPVRFYLGDIRKVRTIVDRFNRRQTYRALKRHHKVLTPRGVGKCSKLRWDPHGRPIGFCDAPAFGRQMRIPPDEYCFGLACPAHGGPKHRQPRFARSNRSAAKQDK